MEKKNTEKINWINGLKGLACIGVFCHHFFLTFYDGIYYGKETASKTVSGIDTMMGYKPFGVLLNGNFYVCLFIMISAFLYAGKIMKADINDKKVDYFKVCIQRYLRLMPSVALIGVIYYVLMKVLLATGLNYINVDSTLSVPELIQHILLYQWVTYDPSIIGPLWCMYILFLGTFISIFLSKLSNKERWYMPLIYLIIAVASVFVNEYYVAVVLGVMLSDIYYYDRANQWKLSKLNVITVRYLLGILIILLGLFLGGFPSKMTPENPVYLLISKIPAHIVLSHSAGAFLIMGGLMVLPTTKLLSSKALGFLGDISFGIYLIHSVVINLLSYYLKDRFEVVSGSYATGVWITFVITVLLVGILSFAFHKGFEEKINKLIKRI